MNPFENGDPSSVRGLNHATGFLRMIIAAWERALRDAEKLAENPLCECDDRTVTAEFRCSSDYKDNPSNDLWGNMNDEVINKAKEIATRGGRQRSRCLKTLQNTKHCWLCRIEKRDPQRFGASSSKVWR